MKATGFKDIFEKTEKKELKLLLRLFSRGERRITLLCEEMSRYVEHRGHLTLKNEELFKDPVNFTITLLEFKEEMERMVEELFDNELSFFRALTKGLGKCMIQYQETPTFIAAYCDQQFR